MTQEQSQALRQLDSAGLVVDDLTLYLDTHPDDAEALKVFIQYRDLLAQAQADYVKAYGPLTVMDVTGKKGWCWINPPWPWEET